jgi:Transposase, Mutator family
MSEVRSVETTAMDITHAIWKRPWDRLLTCRSRAHGVAIKRTCLSGIIVVETILHGAIGEMFVKGVSTAKVGEVIETLTGSHPSASTVSRVFHTLESEYEQWKQRPQASRYMYAFADGTYFTVI